MKKRIIDQQFLQQRVFNRLTTVFAIVFTFLLLAGCGAKQEEVTFSQLKSMNWEKIEEESKKAEVYFYGWGGSQQVNDWLDKVVTPSLEKENGITLKRVPMNIDEILNKLIGEKQAGVKEGTIDVVWLNGENFFTAKDNGLMMGSFTSLLPHYNAYVDQDSRDVLYDFGYEVQGMEAPFGKAQFVLMMDTAKSDLYPKSAAALMEWAKKNPGKLTYPAPPDFTGSAFVRNIAYEIVGKETLQQLGDLDQEEVKELLQPVMDYLVDLKPYLWNEGNTYPATAAQLENLFKDGEVWIMMDYNPNHVATKIANGEYPETVDSFIFEGGTLGNTHFLTVPYNSPNKAGALVTINHIMSPEMQASKYDPNNWGDLPVLSYEKLTNDQQLLFQSVSLGKGVIPQDELMAYRVAEPSSQVALIIEELWLETVGK